jgi:glycosyltransferase involved in cell wall biosynthesis
LAGGYSTAPMRILHVITAFPRSADDVIVPWLVELLKHLRAAGHDVDVLTSAYKGGGNREFAGIPVHRFRYFPARWEDLTHEEAAPDRMRRSLRYRIMPAFYVVCGVWAAWRLGRRQRYDVVHVHWPVPHALFGWAVRRACGARMVTSWYGAELRWVKGSLPWLRPFVRWALATSDQVVAISSYTAHEIGELSNVQPRVIPYTIGFAEGGGGAGVVRGVPPDGFVALFVGRLVERKGVRYLIDALQRISPDRRARLVIIGDGPERQRLEEQVRRSGLEGRVEVRGRVSAHELRQAYANASVFVLPAIVDTRGDTEGLGVVLLEAMSYRVPVIASNLGGITDIVRDGETGLLVPPADVAALGAALERLAADAGLAKRLSEAGHRMVGERFSWPAILARWQACYAAALDAPARVTDARGGR